MSTKPFPLLDLPPEIRERVYLEICRSPLHYIPFSSLTAHTTYPHNLLLVSHQIYQEIRPLYFTLNTFSLTLHRHASPLLTHFLSPQFLDNRRQIRSLRLNIIRWGTKDFFCSSIIPMLEDCILNGKLRVLEVVIRDSFFDGLVNGNGVGQEGSQGWRMLKAICRDPYLETVSLMAMSTEAMIYEEVKERTIEMSFQDVTWLLGDSAHTENHGAQ
jgi:hypothetical protein